MVELSQLRFYSYISPILSQWAALHAFMVTIWMLYTCRPTNMERDSEGEDSNEYHVVQNLLCMHAYVHYW
jgi:hypothetical protein